MSLSFEDPGPLVLLPPAVAQGRLTVAFRLILIIPLAIWLAIVTVAAALGGIVAWFIALVTGRLPEGLAGLLAGWVELNLRFFGFLTFTLAAYPSFSLHPVAEANSFQFIVTPAPLNRLAVLLRLPLAFPMLVVNSLTSQGLLIFSVLSWLITLVLGRLPLPIHNATCATLRFMARVSSYFYMLTPVYPRELFGDSTPAPPGYGVPSAQGSALPLSGGEKALVWLFLVIGLVGSYRNFDRTSTPVNYSTNSVLTAPPGGSSH